MGVYSVNVAGESFRNDDGRSRQAIIRKLRPGDPVRLVPEPWNIHDSGAVAVHARGGQIGYVSRDNSAWVGRVIEDGTALRALVQSTGAPEDRPNVLGVVLEVRTAADAAVEPAAVARRAMLRRPAAIAALAAAGLIVLFLLAV